MIITAINGSYRGDRGYTNFLIELLFQGAREAGAKCSTVHLADCHIERCLACDRCQSKKNQRPCVHEQADDVAAIFRRMKESDIIIYATPIYVFAMSGLLKTFLERFYAKGVVSDLTVSQKGLIFHKIAATICSKPFVSLVCCDNLERETPQNVIDYFETFSKFTDASQVGLLVRNGGRLSGGGKDPKREAKVPRIFDVYEAYRQAGRELARNGEIDRKTEKRANREIVPVPLFGLIKRLHFRPLKKKFVEKALEMMSGRER